MFRSNQPAISGFTLIELLVVMVIMSVSMGIVIPITMGQIDATKERAERERVVYFIEKQRTASLFSGQPIELNFNGTRLSATAIFDKENEVVFELDHISFGEQTHQLSPYFTAEQELTAIIRQKNWVLTIENEKAFWSNVN
ncbi:pilus assembly FimT family protein [Alishewanella longhuensis]